jgi:acetyl esterase/lipase
MSQITTIKNLTYAMHDGVALPMDLYLPRDVAAKATVAPMPVILWLPGGGWFECNKETAPWFYAKHGFAIAAINYRTSDQHPAPANVHDCKAAVRWLRMHAPEYGLDPDRIGVWGKSAGGHLALMLAFTPDHPELDRATYGVSSRVQAACSFYGVSDLVRLDTTWSRQYLRDRHDLVWLLGPINHVSSSVPPTLLFHGDADPVVPIEQSQILHDALRAAGADVEMHVVQGAVHHWNLDLTQERWVRFFRRTLSSPYHGPPARADDVQT